MKREWSFLAKPRVLRATRGSHWLLALAVLFFGTARQANGYAGSPSLSLRAWHAWGESVRTGDLIFRGGTSVESRAVRWLANADAPYSHVGIVLKSPRGVWVAHSLPQEGEGDRGGVRIEPLAAFLNRRDALRAAVYRSRTAADASLEAVRQWTERMAAARMPFDDDFDNSTPDAVYCTEFVMRAFKAGGLQLRAKAQSVALPGQSFDVVFPEALLQDPQFESVIEHSALRR